MKDFNKKIIKHRYIALMIAMFMCFACLLEVHNIDSFAETTDAGTEENDSSEENPEFKADTGRIEFWEWKRLTENNIRTIFNDNKYHPVMFSMYTLSTKNGHTTKSGGYSFVNLPPENSNTHNLTTDSSKEYYIIPGPTAGGGGNNYMFISSFADKDHYFLPPDSSKVNNFKDDFTTISTDPQNTYSPSGTQGVYKLDGWSGKEKYATAYYMNAEETLYIIQDSLGCDFSISQDEFNSNRFFTEGEEWGSMGVPWIKVAAYSTKAAADDKNTYKQAIYMCFPKKILSAEESLVYQPTSSDFFLYCSARHTSGDGSEPTMIISHQQTTSVPQDVWNLVFHKGNAFIMAFNNDFINQVSFDGMGQGALTNSTDSAYFALVGKQDYSIMAIGSKASGFDHDRGFLNLGSDDVSPLGPMQRPGSYMYYRPFVGFPHLFTSIETQTISAGDLYPITTDAFVPAKNAKEGDTTAAKSEGIVLPKGNVLTIDGGTVSVSCKMINNGKIVIKNGGTLVVKKDGCIFPYTKECNGQGTIDCQGGNVVIMEGGSIYGFCNGSTKPDNPYDQTNAPLRLTGGGTLINYGNLILTYGIVDKGSKIENRANGNIFLGYNRSDPLELNPNTSSYLSKSSPNNYSKDSDGRVTIGLFGIRESDYEIFFDRDLGRQYRDLTVDYNGTLINEKTAKITGKDLVYIDITTPEY